MKEQWNAVSASSLKGVGAVISAWAADQCKKTLGRELAADEEGKHGALIRAAKDRELGTGANLEVPETVRIGKPSEATPDARQMISWNMVGGKRDVRAHLVAKGR